MILTPEQVGVIRSPCGRDVVVNHVERSRVEYLVDAGLVDCLIVECEDGFSDLGMMREFVSAELGIGRRDLVKHALDGFPPALEKNIASLADWNRARTDEVTLIAIPPDRADSRLKGLILSPYDGSKVYSKFSYLGYYAHRDFMYAVTYESLRHAYERWGARRILVTHFARSKYRPIYDRDVTTCQVEAMFHFAATHPEIESFTFFDGFLGNRPLDIVKRFNRLRDIGVHRPIKTKELEFWGMSFVELDLSASVKPKYDPLAQDLENMIEPSNMYEDLRSDTVGKAIFALRARTTWNKEKHAIRKQMDEALITAGYTLAASNAYIYRLALGAGFSYLYQVPETKRGHFRHLRGQLVRIVYTRGAKNRGDFMFAPVGLDQRGRSYLSMAADPDAEKFDVRSLYRLAYGERGFNGVNSSTG